MYPVSEPSTPSAFPALDSYILAQVQDIVIVVDNDFRIRSLNPAALRYFDVSEAEALGRRISELATFEYSDSSPETIFARVTAEGHWAGPLSFCNRAGQRYYFDFDLKRLPAGPGLPEGLLSIGRDRTAEQRSEEKVLRKERFYHGLIADALDGILLLNESGLITFASPSIRLVLGFDHTEVLGENAFGFVHPDDRGKAMESLALEVQHNPVVKFITVRLRCKNGDWRWCLVRGHNLLHNPSVNGIAVYFHDDSQRKQAAEALRESEQRFRMLVRNIQVGVMMFNADGRLEEVNEAATRILAVPEGDLLQRERPDKRWQAISEDGRALDFEDTPAYQVLQTGAPVRNFVMGHLPPGSTTRVWLLVNADPVVDEQGSLRFIIVSFSDITYRRELERRLLAEEIAHQRQLTQATIDSSEKERTEIGKELHDNIGQQLTTIKLYLDLARSTADEETAEMVSLATRNISDVINEIRALCRSLIPSTLGDLGLEESVTDLIHTFTRTRHLHIRFRAEGFDEDRVPDNQKLMLFRILQEQLNNIAKHAAARKVIVTLRQDDGQVQLEVSDDGTGFDPATVRRGLGLTSMRNRAEMFGGNVRIESSPGNGCTLTVSIPDAGTAEQ